MKKIEQVERGKKVVWAEKSELFEQIAGAETVEWWIVRKEAVRSCGAVR